MSGTAMIPESQGRRGRCGGVPAGASSRVFRGLALSGLMLAGLLLLLVPLMAVILTAVGAGVLIVGNGAVPDHRFLTGAGPAGGRAGRRPVSRARRAAGACAGWPTRPGGWLADWSGVPIADAVPAAARPGDEAAVPGAAVLAGQRPGHLAGPDSGRGQRLRGLGGRRAARHPGRDRPDRVHLPRPWLAADELRGVRLHGQARGGQPSRRPLFPATDRDRPASPSGSPSCSPAWHRRSGCCGPTSGWPARCSRRPARPSWRSG